MPRKKSEKKIKIRVGRAGRVASPRAVGSGKKGTKQIVNVYITPSGAVSYSTPIRSATVSEPPVVIPQQPSVFQPVFPKQTFQQMQQQEEVPIEKKQYGLPREQVIEKQRQGLEKFQPTSPFSGGYAPQRRSGTEEGQPSSTEKPSYPPFNKKMTMDQAKTWFGNVSTMEEFILLQKRGYIFPEQFIIEQLQSRKK